ncbi:MAG: ABC transporter ATP-binding protein, partial [Acidobacteriota bacterium]|nr:ABC transporter ATP-binding protein [Acidobacteriota bacterium]
QYGDVKVLRNVSLTLKAGEFIAIAGPNGAGKSSLLSVLAGLLAPSRGKCLFLNREAHRWRRRDFARRVAVVMQTEPTAFPFTTEDVVSMGRMPHRSGMYETDEDRAAVEGALAATGALPFRNREFRTLSGGEKQRALLAAALAQSPEVLLLDEPANHLDLHHQIALYALLRELSRRRLLVVAVTHDLNLAAAYADRLVILDHGNIRADGIPADVLGADLISDVFQVHTELHHTAAGQPWLIYGG